jgi:hypothetical protein
MKACIIMHNMIIEHERDGDNVRDSAQHLQLRHDLIEHLYQKYQEQNQTDFD